MKINPILAIDSYKLAHISMYPEQIKETYLNLTPRVIQIQLKNQLRGYYT